MLVPFHCKSLNKMLQIVVGLLAASAQLYTFRTLIHKDQQLFFTI
jgi:hypothetical protein